MSRCYLVTGAAGFIGKSLPLSARCRAHRAWHRQSQRRLRSTAQALAIDRVKRLSAFSIPPPESHEFFRPRAIVQAPDGGSISTASGSPLAAVFNLAARAGVQPSVDDPFVYLRANAHGTLNLLELCRRYSVPKFLLASTSSLYGAHNAVPFSEDADTNRPLSPYAASKKAAEAMAFSYHHLHKDRRQRPPLLHRLRSGRPPRHERLPFHSAHRRGRTDHRLRRRPAGARLHLRGRHRPRHHRGGKTFSLSKSSTSAATVSPPSSASSSKFRRSSVTGPSSIIARPIRPTFQPPGPKSKKQIVCSIGRRKSHSVKVCAGPSPGTKTIAASPYN